MDRQVKILQELSVHVQDHPILMELNVFFATMEPHGTTFPSLVLVQATDCGMGPLVVQQHAPMDLTR